MVEIISEEPPRTVAEWVDLILVGLGNWLLIMPAFVLALWRIAAWLFGFNFPYAEFHNGLIYAAIGVALCWSFYRFLVIRVERWASRRDAPMLAGAALHRKRRIALSFMLVAWFIIAIPLTIFNLANSGELAQFTLMLRALWEHGTFYQWLFISFLCAPWLLPLLYNAVVLLAVALSAKKLTGAAHGH
jgi:hypothetical protein